MGRRLHGPCEVVALEKDRSHIVMWRVAAQFSTRSSTSWAGVIGSGYPRRPEAADSAVQFAEPRDALRTGLGDGNGRDGSATTHAAFTVTLLLTADRRAASSWWTSGTGSGFATIDRNILHLESMLHKRDEVRSENALVYVHEFAAPCSIC